MRVEACGNLEPKTGGGTFIHQSQRLSEPISIINHKNNNKYLLSNKERRYSEMNLFEGEGLIAGRNTLNLELEKDNQTLPIGFFLSDEEWSLFKQPHIEENQDVASPQVDSYIKPLESSLGQSDEMDTLLTFLSKFDDKVAAIWGQEGYNNLQQQSLAEGDNNNIGCGSNSSTPVGDLSYAWGSPSSKKSSFFTPGIPIQTEQQQQALADSQRIAESFNQKQYLSLQRKDYPIAMNLNPPKHKPNPYRAQHLNNNRIAIGLPRISPPKGKHTIMHSIKQYFGIAPTEMEYHIVRKVDVASSMEETEKSLASLNHAEETSGFVRFISSEMIQNEDETSDFEDNLVPVEYRGKSNDVSTEFEINAMRDILDSLDLDCDDLEIIAACKGNPKPFIEPSPPEDLLNSWKTRFNPIEILEAKNDDGQIRSPTPVTELAPHQINHNLPEYKLFNDDGPDQYNIFRYPGKTLFPIKYKVCVENEKSVQTEDLSELTQDNVQQHDTYYQPYTVFNWEGFPPENQHPYVLSNRCMSPAETLGRYDFENNLEIQTCDWNTDGNTGLGSGSLVELDYNYNRAVSGTFTGGGTHHFLHSDYCRDSGIGIDVCSSGFYDDGFPTDYDLDSEYYGSIGAVGEELGAVGFHGLSTNENDVDYGQFQNYSYPVEMASSVSSGKQQGKSSRRRAKVKPCKYFFLDGSCRRGKDCKFSHDLTTCRYWAEGSCLKGDTCPYLHCFLDGNEFLLEQENNTASKRYLLDSENDFPALGGMGSTKSNTKLTSRVQMSGGFLPSPSIQDENIGSGSTGSYGSLKILADPAGCGPVVGMKNYAFGDRELEMYGGAVSGHGAIEGFNGFPSTMNKLSFGIGTSMMNNGANGEQKGKGKGNSKQKKTGIKRLGDENSGAGGTLIASTPTTRTVNGKGITGNWNSSLVINVKEKRKKKKH